MDLFLDWLFADKLRTGLISCISAFLWIKIKERKEYVSLLASLVRISKETLHFHAQKTFVSIQHTLRNDKKHRVFSSTSSILIHKIILFFLSSPHSFSRSTTNTRSLSCSRVSGPLLVSIERLSRAALAPFRIELPRFPRLEKFPFTRTNRRPLRFAA